MSVQKITQTLNLCVCEIPDCPGKGKPWKSLDERIPERCKHCGRRTWNRKDKRQITILTAHGKTQRLFLWAKETGISNQLIRHRLSIGWSEEDAVSIPPGEGYFKN